jgi:hypothetical protein
MTVLFLPLESIISPYYKTAQDHFVRLVKQQSKQINIESIWPNLRPFAQAYNQGKISTDELITVFEAQLGITFPDDDSLVVWGWESKTSHRTDKKDFIEAWNMMFSVSGEAVQILKAIEKLQQKSDGKFKVVLYANTNPLHLQKITKDLEHQKCPIPIIHTTFERKLAIPELLITLAQEHQKEAPAEPLFVVLNKNNTSSESWTERAAPLFHLLHSPEERDLRLENFLLIIYTQKLAPAETLMEIATNASSGNMGSIISREFFQLLALAQQKDSTIDKSDNGMTTVPPMIPLANLQANLAAARRTQDQSQRTGISLKLRGQTS